MNMQRPEPTEYAPFYAGYVAAVPEDDILKVLSDQIAELTGLLRDFDETRADFAYAPGKWTIREVIGHLIDGERVFAYRALRFARGDTTALPGYDQDLFVANCGLGSTPVSALLEELILLRRANISFFRQLPTEAWSRSGVASDVPVTVRAIAFIIAGHIRHHLRILQERYFVQ